MFVVVCIYGATKNYCSDDSSSEETTSSSIDDSLAAKDVRSVYLVTYSQADIVNQLFQSITYVRLDGYKRNPRHHLKIAIPFIEIFKKASNTVLDGTVETLSSQPEKITIHSISRYPSRLPPPNQCCFGTGKYMIAKAYSQINIE